MTGAEIIMVVDVLSTMAMRLMAQEALNTGRMSEEEYQKVFSEVQKRRKAAMQPIHDRSTT